MTDETLRMNRRTLLAGCAVLAPSLFFRSAFASPSAAGTFTAVVGDHFLLNGRPYQVISGRDALRAHSARVLAAPHPDGEGDGA